MTALVAAALAMARQGEVQKDFSIDLLLVADNGTAIKNWDWIDKPADDTTIQGLLRQEVTKLQKGDCKYLILDGGMSSVFVPKKGNREIEYFYRISNYSPTLVETWKSHGVVHTRKSRWARLNTGQYGGYITSFGMPGGYSAQAYLYIDSTVDHSCVEFNDLTTLRTLTRDRPEEVPQADKRVLLSEKSIADTIEELGPEASKGVCFCEWGMSDPAYPNIVSYPPAGMVAHYKLSRTNGQLGLKFLEYLGSPTYTY